MKHQTLHAFTPDPNNANKGTDRGRSMLRESLRKSKAGRSILVDKNNVVIAGNKTRSAAIAEGVEEAIVVETDGSKLVVVKRTDLDLETDEAAKLLAVADNRTSEFIDWDSAVLSDLADDIDLSGLWTEEEWLALADADPDDAPTEEPETEPSGARNSEGGPQQLAVAIECADEAEQQRLYNLLTAQGYACRVLAL